MLRFEILLYAFVIFFFFFFRFKVQGSSRFFIIRHIHNHTSIISSEMQVELKKNTAFTWGKGGEKNNPQTMLLGEYSVRTGKTPQQHKSTYTT